MSDKPIRILLVEDNPGDVRLIQEMLAEGSETSFSMESVDQLSKALNHVKKSGVDLVLLDLRYFS